MPSVAKMMILKSSPSELEVDAMKTLSRELLKQAEVGIALSLITIQSSYRKKLSKL
jgi:hypothetical protein